MTVFCCCFSELCGIQLTHRLLFTFRHMYHRACIDPWLLKHRSCPLCKQNILIACGLSLGEEDIESCSATTSEFNSGFSLSSNSSASNTSSGTSPGLDGSALCFPLLTTLTCRRHRRRRRRPHPFRYMEHLRRPSSSLDEVSAPSASGEGRRVLGSASENSSSSRSVPSDLYFHGNLGSEKGARFAFDEIEEEESSFAGGRGRRRHGSGRRGLLMLRQARRCGWRTRNLMLSNCCCGGGNRSGTVQVGKGEIVPSPLVQQAAVPPLPYLPLPSSVTHPSASLLYHHLPQSLPLSQVPSGNKPAAALPSYEQVSTCPSTLPDCIIETCSYVTVFRRSELPRNNFISISRCYGDKRICVWG